MKGKWEKEKVKQGSRKDIQYYRRKNEVRGGRMEG